MLRVAFMGSPDFAVPCLHALLDERDRVDVRFVVTQPDKPAGRGQQLQAPAVKLAAVAAGLPVLQPPSVRKPPLAEAMRGREPPFDKLLDKAGLDLIVVVAYGKILPAELLAFPRLGCWNVHGSLLPKYRGAAPIQWSVLDGESETGVTLMQMDVGMDTGHMLLQRSIPIAPEDTAGTMYEKLAPVGAEVLREGLRRLKEGTLVAEKQDDARATMAPMLEKESGLVDWTMPAGRVRDRVRGMDPWPVAYTVAGGQQLRLWGARLVEESAAAAFGGAAPGTLVDVRKDGAWIACGEGVVSIAEGQLPGRKRMAMSALAAGRAIARGLVLGA